MVEIAISLAAKVAEYFVAPIVRPFSYIWNYKTNFQNLESEVGKLKGKQDEVHHLVDDARRNGEDIEQRVNVWLDTVQKKVVEVSPENIQEQNEQANMKCFNGLCPNPKKLYQHSRKAVRMAKSIVELQQEGNFQKVSYRTIPEETWIPSHKGYEAFESRMSTMENILYALSNPDVNMLSIYGVGGIGKTTLARAVAKHAEDNKLFDVVAFAEVSAVPDIRKIQGEIADMLGLTFREESIPGRASKLHEYLKQEGQKRKILLVLDNIWATLELDKVGIPFGDDCKGCKVLLTARDLDALKTTGSQLDFSMDVLKDQETWNLFSTTAGDCVEQSDLQVLAKEVATACGGLPIAIVTIAKALRNKKEFEWSNALRELENPSQRTLKGVAGPTYSCIEYSYNQLKDEELESIFLLCSTMGSTNNASIGDLVKYGMGLRIFKGINRINEARDRVETLVRKLKDASLLLDTPNDGSFSMHDVVCDVGRLIASINQQVVIGMDDNVQRDWDDDDTLKTSTKIFLHNISELPKELDCQHLEFLYMQTKGYDRVEIPANFFTQMSKLRVLHLVGFDLLSLPTSLRLLVNLQTLCMDDCDVENIALIGELKKLEILSIDNIMRLPEEVCKLTRLRLLDLSTCYKLKEIPPNIIASLTQLEELYWCKSYDRWEVQGGSNASLDELKCLPHLTVLEIQIPNTNVLSKGLFSNTLERYNINIGQRSNNFHFQLEWPKTSRKLELNLGDNCSCLEDVLHKTPSVKNVLSALDGGEGFPKLKQLWVHHSSCFHTVADCSESEFYYPFPSLETLFLEKLNNLEKIYNGQFGAGFLRQFRNIKVEKCDKLKNIFSFSTIRALPLEEIYVRDCENITEIFAIGKEEDKIDLKELRSMTLEGLSKLTSFCSINNNGVILEDTPTATFNGKVGFPNLKTLKLVRINSVKYLFSSPTVAFPSLERIIISDMNDLEMIWQNQLAVSSQGKLSFQKLNEVMIINCWSLKSIFPASIARNLSQLEQLHISVCGAMEKIVAEEEGADLEAVTRFDFPRLTSLKLIHLSQLRYFYPGRHTAEWPELKELRIEGIDKIGLLASEGQLNIPAQQQPLFSVEKGCFLKLEELGLTGGSLRLISQAQFSEHLIPKLKFLKVYNGGSVFPPDILWRFPNLEKLEFDEGSFEEEIFSLEEVEKHAERPAQIKSLKLFGLEELKRIWKQHSKLDLIIQKLEFLDVRGCGLIDLLPPSAIFRNLKILHVEFCYKLTSILTSTTAESLVQLTEMKIESCDMLTEVVARDEGDVTKNKIIFHKLKTLQLSSLSSLTNFCVENYTFEFPALEKLEVVGCYKMEIFCPGVLSTPKLNKVYKRQWNTADWIWEGDLNTTIQEMYTTIQEMYRERNKRKNAESSEEDTESSEEDGSGFSTQHLVLQNEESSEEHGAGPSTQHQVLQNTESSEEDGSGLSTQHLVLQNEESSEEEGAGPSTRHLEPFSCGTNKEGVSHIVEWNEDEGTVKRAYKGFEERSFGVVQLDTTKNKFLAAGDDHKIKFWGTDNNSLLTTIDAEGCLPIGDSRNIEDVRSRLAEEVNNWRLTEINEHAQFRSLRLVSRVQTDKIARLVYTNSGTRILALTLNAIHLLWKWPQSETNPNGKATTNVSPQFVQPGSGILMTNDLTNANPAESVSCFAVSKNDSYLVSASGGKVSLFNMMSFRTMATFGFPTPVPTYLAFHPADNNIIAIGMDDSTIHIYNVRIDKIKARLSGHSKRISCLAFSHVSKTLVSAGADAEMILWSTDKWERMESTALNFPPGKTLGAMSNTQVQFHHNQTHFLAANETQLAIYDAMKFECLNQWVVGGSLAPISHATFSGDSQLVYASFLDGALRIFAAQNLQLQCQINPSAYLQPSSPMFPTVVAAHPLNPNQFAVGLTDGGVYVFEPLESDGQWGVPPDQQAVSSLRHQP